MKAKYIRGERVPYEKPISELKELLLSSNETNFVLACEALSYSKNPDAYELLKSYINHKDIYKRLCVISSIFRMPQSSELVCHLEKALSSTNHALVGVALEVIADYRITVSEKQLRSAVNKHFNIFMSSLELSPNGIDALSTLSNSPDNYVYLTELYKHLSDSFQREKLCDILLEKYLNIESKELFDLFKQDKSSMIRKKALLLGKKFGYDTSLFLSDDDECIRKQANNSF